MKKLISMVILGMFLISGMIGCVKKEKEGGMEHSISSFYKPLEYKVKENLTKIVPLNLDKIENKDALKFFNLNKKQLEFLKNKGFVLIKGNMNNLSKVYRMLKMHGIPIFITSDTFLHLYHIQFNEILKEIEEKFYYDLLNLTKAMLNKSKEDYNNYDGILKEASRRNVAYFSVALFLLGKEDIPNYVEKEVNKEIKNIEEHTGMKESSIFHYKEDYSQYVARGHYSGSEKLKRYFKAMMWYGRMAFFLQAGLVKEEDAKISTIQAIMIAWNLNHVKVGEGVAIKIWERIYITTSFFVGVADDLTPYDYIKAYSMLPSFNPLALKNEKNLNEIRDKLKKMAHQKIYGGSGFLALKSKDEWNKKLNETAGMRFMGQRYTPDAFIFQQLVSPMVGMYVGDDSPFTMCMTEGGAARCFPRGLDVMAVLGSDDALNILEEEGDTAYAGENTSYYKQMEMLREGFKNMSIEEWNRNLYFGWLYTLMALINLDGKYPDFMENKEWKYKELQTSLASWSELRHDTILYAKQSYTAYLTGIPTKSMGYVEPLPQFYSRLYSLINMTINGLNDLHVIGEGEEKRLEKLKNMVYSAFQISIDEIEGKSLDKYGRFFTNFVDEIDRMVKEFDEDAIKVTMVADVHTDLNTNMCLEEGVGNLDFAIVSFYNNGKIYVAAGPILSYYEFKQPIDDRLTDKEWEKMIGKVSTARWQLQIYPK